MILKPTVKRGLMLDFIPNKIIYPVDVNPNRIFKLNNNEISDGDIIYLASREIRLEDNYAVIFGQALARKYNKKFKIIVIVNNIFYSEAQSEFLKNGIDSFRKDAMLNDVEFEILNEIPQNIAALVTDFNPIDKISFKFLSKQIFPVFQVDSHNIVPARYISNKQEYSAATLRRKIYANIAEFLTEFPGEFKIIKSDAMKKLDDFIKNKLDFYAELKNNPSKDFTSNLSPYLHFGFISSQRMVLEVLKSSARRENKEAFLEELIVRKELSDNYCLYNDNFKNFKGIPIWGQNTLNEHRSDIRNYIYSINEFEKGKTHDPLWNKTQNDLVKTGRIHGYLRMYWAKKILEWTLSPEEALKIAVYLNDTYALDGNDSNGYVGILWSIGGLHDRPFTNRLVTGKIRYMKGKNI